MRVTNQITRHLASLKESQLLPPLTGAYLNFFTLTFRALGRNHIVKFYFSYELKTFCRYSRNLVNPFMRVTNQITRHLASLKESQLLPPLTRAYLNFFTLTFRALGRNHIVKFYFSYELKNFFIHIIEYTQLCISFYYIKIVCSVQLSVTISMTMHLDTFLSSLLTHTTPLYVSSSITIIQNKYISNYTYIIVVNSVHLLCASLYR